MRAICQLGYLSTLHRATQMDFVRTIVHSLCYTIYKVGKKRLDCLNSVSLNAEH